MLLQNMKTDISCNRFGGNGDVIIEHYIDEGMLNACLFHEEAFLFLGNFPIDNSDSSWI